jgi:acyl carrier protein
MTTAAVIARVRRIVSTLFGVSAEEVTETSSPATIPRWDSMGHLTLVLELEQEFGVAFPPEQVERMSNVGEIAEIVSNATAN